MRLLKRTEDQLRTWGFLLTALLTVISLNFVLDGGLKADTLATQLSPTNANAALLMRASLALALGQLGLLYYTVYTVYTVYGVHKGD
jgi:hypothetical protein